MKKSIMIKTGPIETDLPGMSRTVFVDHFINIFRDDIMSLSKQQQCLTPKHKCET